MTMFVLQSLFLLLIACVLGWLIGRWLKGILCPRHVSEEQSAAETKDAEEMATGDVDETLNTSLLVKDDAPIAMEDMADKTVAPALTTTENGLSENTESKSASLSEEDSGTDPVDKNEQRRLRMASAFVSATSAASEVGREADTEHDGIPETAEVSKAGKGFHGFTTDNLQVIEGIGPKMESILHENGVITWDDIAAESPSSLRVVLDQYGDQYRLVDPTAWIEEARLAAEGKVDELIALQKQDGVSKLEGMIGASLKAGFARYKPNDLKIVEGIGPKIETLFKRAGIEDWEALAATSQERLKELLNEAGPRYRLADPETWPTQADMAAKGEWDKLKEYQDILQGGRAS